MADNFKRINKGLTFRPVGTPANPTNGDLYYNSTSNRFIGRINGVSDPLVSEAAAQTLTNKTFDASSNTVTNITNANIAAAAGIVYSKLNLTNGIVNADINTSAAIAYSKLNLALSIVNADISASAAIVYSKLNLSNGIVDGDVNSAAAIQGTKINPNFGLQDVITTARYYVGTNASGGVAGYEINAGNNLNSVDVKGFYANFLSPSGATGSVRGVQINIGTSAAAYTSAQAIGVLVNPITLGAGSTITRAISLLAGVNTVGTNNAEISDNVAFTGNWGLNLTTTNPHYFAAPIRAGTLTAIGSGSEQISSVSSGVAVGTLAGAVVTQGLRSDNAAITGNTRVVSSTMTRTITTSQTDTGAYSWFLGNGGTITIPSGQTYTSSGTWAGFQHAFPSISGAGTSAISAMYGVLVGASATNYGTGKAGIAVGAQSGNTNNVGLLLGTTTIPTGTFELYSAGTNYSVLAGGLRVGTTAAVTSGSEGLSNLYALTSDPALGNIYGAVSQVQLTSNSANTSTLRGIYGLALRVSTANVTDTLNIAGGVFQATAQTDSGHTITVPNISGIEVARLSNNGGAGSISGNYNGIFFTNDATVSITGLKTSILLGTLSGGSVGNARLADNTSYTGSWFINSTSTNPSLFSGPLEWKQQATPSNPSSGQNRIYFKSDNKVYILDSSGTESQLAAAGSGVTGPGTSTVDAIPRWANTGGTSLANSSILINSLNQVGLGDGTISSTFLLSLIPSAANFSTIAGGGAFGAGIRITLNAPSTMTSAVQGMVLRTNTSAAAFTLAQANPILIIQDAKGAGSTITEYCAIRFGRNSASGTNNAFISDSTGFTGTWFINNDTITDSSRFLGPLRLGAATTDLVGTGPEQLTLINNSTLNTSAVRGGVFRANLNSNSAGTAAINAVRAEAYRQATAAVTDTTSQLSGLVARVAIDVGAGNVYTNNGVFGADIQLGGLVLISGSTPAIANWAMIYASADSQANTGRKTGIQLNGVSGGTVGNAIFADNSAFTGDYLFNFSGAGFAIGSSGNMRLGDTTAPATTTGFRLTGTALLSTGVSQFGMIVDPTCSTSATTEYESIRSEMKVPNSAFTLALGTNFYAFQNIPSATPTVTRYVSFYYAGNNGFDATNVAILSDNSAFTGKYFINYSGTSASTIGSSTSTAAQLINGAFSARSNNATPVGGDTASFINNNSGASAHSTLRIGTSGGSTASSSLWFNNLSLTSWAIGCDATDSGKFKIAQGVAQVAGSGIEFFSITTTGAAAFLGTTNSTDILAVGNQSATANTAVTGATQNGLGVDFTTTSGATSLARGIRSVVRTPNTAFTLGLAVNFLADTIIKGAASTITRSVQYMTSGDLTIATNNAQIADNSTFTGNYAINLASVSKSALSAPVTITLSDTSNGLNTGLRLTGSSTGWSTSAAQYASYADPIFNSNATTEGHMYSGQVNTANSSFTLPLATVFNAIGTAKGASNTITRMINFYGVNQTVGTNNAFMADNAAFTGNFFIHQSGTATTSLGGNLTTNQAVSTAGFDTASPATAGTVTASANKPGVLITPAGTIATCTIKLPSSPIDGQQYWVASSQQITAVTWQDAGGTAGNVIGGQATIGGTNRGQNFVYSSTNTKWYSIG